MAQDRPTAGLYDFLYRDSGRFTSYYAQLFGGRLSSLEHTESDRSVDELASRFGVGVAYGDLKHTGEGVTSSRRTIDPHALITTDVLSALVRGEHAYHEPKEAPHGSLLLVEGTVVFVDHSIAELARLSLETTAKLERNKPRAQRSESILAVTELLGPLLKQLHFPSAVLLETPEGERVAGTLKEEGMEEPISTYYFRHGAAGLSGVYLVGIKEQACEAVTLDAEQLLGASQQAAQALMTLLLPSDAHRVTPIALFRKLL